VVRFILVVTASSSLRYSLRSSNEWRGGWMDGWMMRGDSHEPRIERGYREKKKFQKEYEETGHEPLNSERLWQVAGETCTNCDD